MTKARALGWSLPECNRSDDARLIDRPTQQPLRAHFTSAIEEYGLILFERVSDGPSEQGERDRACLARCAAARRPRPQRA